MYNCMWLTTEECVELYYKSVLMEHRKTAGQLVGMTVFFICVICVVLIKFTNDEIKIHNTRAVKDEFFFNCKSQFFPVLKCTLQGYSGVNLIHGLTHCETVLDYLSWNQVRRPFFPQVLSTSETAAWQYAAVNGSKYKPPPKSHK